jgi:hypothetical protein
MRWRTGSSPPTERQDAIFDQLCHQFGQRNRKASFALSLQKDFDTD